MPPRDPDTSAALDQLSVAAVGCPLATPCPADFDLAEDVERLLHCRLLPQAQALMDLARRVSRACSGTCPMRPSLDRLSHHLEAAQHGPSDAQPAVRTIPPAEPSSEPPHP